MYAVLAEIKARTPVGDEFVGEGTVVTVSSMSDSSDTWSMTSSDSDGPSVRSLAKNFHSKTDVCTSLNKFHATQRFEAASQRHRRKGDVQRLRRHAGDRAATAEVDAAKQQAVRRRGSLVAKDAAYEARVFFKRPKKISSPKKKAPVVDVPANVVKPVVEPVAASTGFESAAKMGGIVLVLSALHFAAMAPVSPIIATPPAFIAFPPLF